MTINIQLYPTFLFIKNIIKFLVARFIDQSKIEKKVNKNILLTSYNYICP